MWEGLSGITLKAWEKRVDAVHSFHDAPLPRRNASPPIGKKETLPTQSALREDRTVWTHPAFTYHHVRLHLIGLPNHPTTENSGACPLVVQIPKKAGPNKRKGCVI